MKRPLLYYPPALLLFFFYTGARAQAPNIVYNPASYNYTVGSSFGSISPVNSGGAVPAVAYGTVSTYSGIAGTPTAVNSTIPLSTFNNPRALAFDYTNNLIYVADAANNVIRKIDIGANTVTTYAGLVSTSGGTTNGTPGTPTSARFNAPYAITYDGAGNLYIAEYGNSDVRRINISTGTVSTINPGSVTVNQPAGIVYDPVSGAVYVGNYSRNNILKITNPSGTTPTVAVFAGSTSAATGSTDANGTNARFNGPNGVSVDGSGNVYVSDQSNGSVRVITPAGAVSTLAIGFTSTRGLDVDLSGNVYVTDDSNKINIVSPSGTVTVVAGTGATGSTNGAGSIAKFNSCRGITVNKITGDIYICDYGNNLIRTIAGSGYFIDNPLPAGLSFNATTGVVSGSPTALFAVNTYNVTAFNSSGSSTTPITLGCGQTVTWTGNANGANGTRWANTGNWSTGAVPTAADNVEIGVVEYLKPANEPAITAADVTVNSIKFGAAHTAGPALTITGRTLNINNNITVNTTAVTDILGTGGILNMAPGSVINLTGTGKLDISTVSLVLNSDATGSASIGKILTPANFTGTSLTNAKVQRYVTGGSAIYRGYRLLSSPVYAATVNSANVYSLAYIQASALVAGTPTGSGFDKSGANPSLFLFREDKVPNFANYGAGNWPGISKINNTPAYNYGVTSFGSAAANFYIPVGNGFLFFFRGNRTVTNNDKYTPGNPAESVTFTASGTLNIGSITVRDWYTPTLTTLGNTATGGASVQGFNLVGNPYPSNIDWDTFGTGISATNVLNTYYVLDPVSKNYGSYQAGSGGAGNLGATNIIPSGQGFFVRAAVPGTASLTFNETAKTTSQVVAPNLLMGQPVATTVSQYMHLSLAKDQVNTDETLVLFKSQGSTSFKPDMDAPYRVGNGVVSLASRSNDQVDVAIKNLSLPQQQSETLGLNVGASTDGIYSLTLKDIVAVPPLYDVWLMDAYKKDSLDIRHNLVYRFNIYKNDSASFGPKRFSLVLRQNPAFAYRLINFSASKVSTARQVEVSWNTENEANYTNFTVERSTDNGKSFDVLATVSADGQGNYSFLDKSPLIGSNLYKLKQVDINNNVSYSKIVTIQYANLSNNLAGSKVSIYPNPVSSTINLAINTDNTGTAIYNIKFMSSTGMVVKEITSAQPSWQGSINNLQPGTYVIRVINNTTQNLVGENKFVKL